MTRTGRPDRSAARPPVTARLFSDERLAARAAANDKRSFAEIYRRYGQDLYRFCLSIVGNPEDAGDALQNTMAKALKALPGEERQIRLRPWLYRVAHNESVELLRRRRETVEFADDLAAPGGGPAETAAQRERLSQLLCDLAELPERQRSMLTMRELAGLEFDQIGEAFGTSPAVVRQTIYEARLSLRQLAEGREMGCEEVTRLLSDADGRVRRRRNVQAHLRACPDCRAFAQAIEERRHNLASLAPLPAVASAGILQAVLGGGHAAGGTAAGTAVAAGTGKVAASSVLAKSVATVAVAATVGVSAADRSGLVDAAAPPGGLRRLCRAVRRARATRPSPPPRGQGRERARGRIRNAPRRKRLARARRWAQAPPVRPRRARAKDRRHPRDRPRSRESGRRQSTGASRTRLARADIAPSREAPDPRDPAMAAPTRPRMPGAGRASRPRARPPPARAKPVPRNRKSPPRAQRKAPQATARRKDRRRPSAISPAPAVPPDEQAYFPFRGWFTPNRSTDVEGGTMKLRMKIALATCALALTIPAMALANNGNGKGQGGPNYETAPPPPAKAYGKYCQGESKKHVKGEKGTAFSRCVKTAAQAARNEDQTPGQVCKGKSKKHVKGEKGTEFSRCVKSIAQLRHDEHEEEQEEQAQV